MQDDGFLHHSFKNSEILHHSNFPARVPAARGPAEKCLSSLTLPSAISARPAGDGLATALEGIAASLSGGVSLNSKEMLRSIATLARTLARTSSAQHVLAHVALVRAARPPARAHAAY